MIVSNYLPGALGRITELHAGFYHRHAGFGLHFERKVACEFAEFLGRETLKFQRVIEASGIRGTL